MLRMRVQGPQRVLSESWRANYFKASRCVTQLCTVDTDTSNPSRWPDAVLMLASVVDGGTALKQHWVRLYKTMEVGLSTSIHSVVYEW